MLKMYLTGVLITWIMMKILRIVDKDKSWEGITVSVAISIFSWVGMGAAIFAMVVHFVSDITWNKISNFLSRTFKKPPPNWL